MNRPDDYDLSTAAGLGGRHSTETLLTAICAAIYATATQPASGARVIRGWRMDDGDIILSDEPVLWFDHDGRPVVTESEEGMGFDALSPTIGEKWSVYHPDTHIIGRPDFDPKRAAMQAIRQQLTEDTNRQAGTK